MKRIFSEKGWTLVELLAAVTIIGIISAIAAPAVVALVEQTRENSYEINRQRVIAAERYYQLVNEEPSKTVKQLIDEGFLERIPLCNDENIWEWNNEIDRSSRPVSENDFLPCDMQTPLLVLIWDQIKMQGDWKVHGSIGEYVMKNMENGENRMFFQVDNTNIVDEFDLSIRAKLTDLNSDKANGYGVFINSDITEDDDMIHDTGYIIQYDRGENGILLDQRENGEVIERYWLSEGDNLNWNAEHILNISTENIINNEQEITIQILSADGEKLILEESKVVNRLHSDEQLENLYTGIRAWGGKENIEIYDFSMTFRMNSVLENMLWR